jgi:hypothetical protein
LFPKADRFLSIAHILLLVGIAAGLIFKLIISLNLSLSSDMVYSGMVCREIWVHQNVFLNFFYTPSVGPYYFSEIIPFQLIPQIITNFNPVALKVMTFIIFCLLVAVFSCLIYKITKNITNTLIFAALVSLLTPMAYNWYDWPSSHTATIFWIGILLLLLFEFPKVKIQNYILALVVLLLVVFSDSIILLWFVIPALMYYIYFYFVKDYKNINLKLLAAKSLNAKGFSFVFISIILMGFVIIYEKYFIPFFLSYSPLELVGPGTIQNNFNLFIQGFFSIYNDSLFKLVSFSQQLSPLDYLTIVASGALLVYSLLLVRRIIHEKIFIFIFISGIFMAGFYILTNLPKDFISTHYLGFLGITLFIVIALCFQKNNKYFLTVVILVVLLNGALNVTYIAGLKGTQNQEQYNVITYLEENQLNLGFGDFWDANLLTYLSGERVTVRGILAAGNQIAPFRWHSAEHWYSLGKVDKLFILVKNDTANRPFINDDTINSYLVTHPPAEVLQYSKYHIYVYNQSPK